MQVMSCGTDDARGLDLSGMWVPVVTPFDAELVVDEAALARLAGRLLGDGAAGLVALGTTGEPATLRPDERRHVVEVCAAQCAAAGKPLVVGAGTNSTTGTIEEIEMLSAGGCSVGDFALLPSVESVRTNLGAEKWNDHKRMGGIDGLASSRPPRFGVLHV